MGEERFEFTNAHGDRLSGVLHRSDRASVGGVILCHGMESDKSSEKLIYLANQLAARGIAALRFDFRYVGESSGQFADITYSGEAEDLAAAYAFVRERVAGKIAILGSSMGGTVALLFAAREPSVAALVTVAAPVHPENFPKRVLPPKGIQRWRERGYTIFNGQRLNLSLLQDLEKIDVPAAARRVRCPVLVLHGDQDEVVPVAEAYELHENLPESKRLEIFTATDHRFSDPATMQRAMTAALEWLTQHVR
jgi:putative redox protein